MPQQDRPNILWISFEDTNPFYGCYGDPTGITPNLDTLAREGAIFTNCYATAGVCAPARSAIITGMYPTSIGTHHMRTTHENTHSPAIPTPYSAVVPHYVKCFTEYLRAAGYFCTNNLKTDYQFEPPGSAWDELGPDAHWRNRPDKSRPFFAVFNPTRTHESGMWEEKESEIDIDPATVRVPPYFPDTPKVRTSLAKMHGNIARSDQELGALLAALEEDGLTENTIVMHWSDHGPLPRGKRWPYDSGLRVPLIIKWPTTAGNPGAGAVSGSDEWQARATVNAAGGHLATGEGDGVLHDTSASPRNGADSDRNPVADHGFERRPPLPGFEPGSITDRLVSTVDLGPTVLSLAGIPAPPYMQGRPFLGPDATPERRHVFATRDRYDTSYDMVRAARDRRFKLLENNTLTQERLIWVSYRNRHPIVQELYAGHVGGGLSDEQRALFDPRTPVELYDTWNDPYELHNLAGKPEYAETEARLRKALAEWRTEVGDMGMISEEEMVRRWYPGGMQPQTERPITMVLAKESFAEEPVSRMTVKGPAMVQIQCSTQGASIEYRPAKSDRWLLYSEPFAVPPGSHAISVRAFRIGYKPSSEHTLELTVE